MKLMHYADRRRPDESILTTFVERVVSEIGAYQEFCVRGHSEARFGLGETHDHTERIN